MLSSAHLLRKIAFYSFSIHLVVTFYLKPGHPGSVQADSTPSLWVDQENENPSKAPCHHHPATHSIPASRAGSNAGASSGLCRLEAQALTEA